jgi:hypothetical protein
MNATVRHEDGQKAWAIFDEDDKRCLTGPD